VGAADALAPSPPADPFCAARSGTCLRPPYITVVSAFPAELEPLLTAADVRETIATGSRLFHIGTLGGARVVLVRGGIGFVNATTTTQAALDRFRVAAILFSGVAGSGLNIGDVAIPATWTDHTDTFTVDPALLAVARTLSAPPVVLEQCTPVPPDRTPPSPLVCMPQPLKIVAGGSGESADAPGANGHAVPCRPGISLMNLGAVFDCDDYFTTPHAIAAAAVPDATDEETAAVARVARDAGVPFLGFRGVSDGNGDPLNLGGFPGQFFSYYRISADNAGATAIAFLGAWSKRHAAIAGRSRRGTPPAIRFGAACDWPHALGPACAREPVPGAVTRLVARACSSLADADAAAPGSPDAAVALAAARGSWAGAAQRLQRGRTSSCRTALAAALETRAGATP
jgi:nucleoside phosphorylase